jgi:hypothetical protein
LKPYLGFIKLGAAAAIIFAAVVNDATFVAYVPAVLLLFWSFDD